MPSSSNSESVPTSERSSSLKQEQSHGDHDKHDNAQSMPFYLPPKQRQRWTDDQQSPHTDWGDIFFDLFYVAAAYNLGNLLREDPSSSGLLYLIGCFFPIMSIWANKMYHASRFYVEDDIFHRLFEVASLVPLATAVLHIRTVPILSDPENKVDMFAFSLSITIAHVLALARSIEIILCQKVFKTEGLYTEAFRNSRRDCLWVGIPTLFFLTSSIYSGMKYYGDDNEADRGAKDDDHRLLAGAVGSYGATSEDDTAVYLNIFGAVSGNVVMGITLFIVFGSWKEIDHKEYFVPMNIDYSIHRWGEWIMLLLGESVLSLLIVDLSEGAEYYATFFCGVVTVILLEYLHFRSQPHEPDGHAMRRSKAAGYCFGTLMWVYSASLIILGTTYKMFLFEFVYADDEGERRNLLPIGRLLASETSALRFETDDRQQRIAHFFSGSLALVWLCLDSTIVTHRGLGANMARVQGSARAKVWVVFLVALRCGLILFIATVSQYVSEPSHLAVIGAAGVFSQLFLRVLLNFALPVDEKEEEERTLERMATQLNARLRTQHE